MSASLDHAGDFILRNARTLERRRYEHHFDGAPAEHVLAALGAYRNADGGFGQALEADLRVSDSQPVMTEVALAVMHEVGAVRHAWLSNACEFLAGVAAPSGQLRTILPSALNAPRARHWETDSWDPQSPNPTGGIVGYLHALEAAHPWLDQATEWLWGRVDGGPLEDAHEALGMTLLLSHVPDRERAESALAQIMAQLPSVNHYLVKPSDEYGLSPLRFAPTPDAATRAHLDDSQIHAHLDALEAQQQDDGGWPIAWEPPSAAAVLEWRGVWTLDALLQLRAWGRI